MRSYTSLRVVKSGSVEVNEPRIIDCSSLQLAELTRRASRVAWEQLSATAEMSEFEIGGHEAFGSDEYELSDAKAHDRASQIIAQAEAEAVEIRRQAQDEGEALKVELQRQAEEEIFPEARKKGYVEGYNTGTDDGIKFTAEAEKKLEEAKAQWTLARRAVQEEFSKVDEELLHLAVKIAEQITRAQIVAEPKALLERIRALTLLPQERAGWILHLSVADAEWIDKLEPEERPPYQWIPDEHLAAGDCYLECQEGLFDARMSAQLEKLEQCLQEELKHGRME